VRSSRTGIPASLQAPPLPFLLRAFEYIIKPRSGLGDVDPAAVKRATLEWLRFTTIPDRHLQDRRWLVGSGPTIADVAAASILPYAGRAPSPGRIPRGRPLARSLE